MMLMYWLVLVTPLALVAPWMVSARMIYMAASLDIQFRLGSVEYSWDRVRGEVT